MIDQGTLICNGKYEGSGRDELISNALKLASKLNFHDKGKSVRIMKGTYVSVDQKLKAIQTGNYS